MNANSDIHSEAAWRESQELIARQASEIDALRLQLDEEQFAEELREAVVLGALVGTVASPASPDELLRNIIVNAAAIIGAEAAALFLLDAVSGELTFEVAIGGGAPAVSKYTLPAGQGIAGHVATTRQSLTVDDPQHHPQWQRDLARDVGYTPRNILCVPMFVEHELIGVIELCDKQSGSSFDESDSRILETFANQAALTIELAKTQTNILSIIHQVLHVYSDVDGQGRERLQHRAQEYARNLERISAYQEKIELAHLVQAIVWRGQHEFEACRTILRGFADYLRVIR